MGTPVVMLDVDVAALQESAVQAAVRGAFAQLAAGRAVQPQQVVTELPGGGDVIAYQGVLADDGVYAVKVSPYLPQPAGKPVVTAWTLLLSTLTGEPLLLVDAGALTVERTAATTAVAVDLLARADASTVAVIGWGPVGRAHLRHALAVRDLTDVRVYSPSTTADDLESPGMRLAGIGRRGGRRRRRGPAVHLGRGSCGRRTSAGPRHAGDVGVDERTDGARDRSGGAGRARGVRRPRARGVRCGRGDADRRRRARLHGRPGAWRPDEPARRHRAGVPPATSPCSSDPWGSASRMPPSPRWRWRRVPSGLGQRGVDRRLGMESGRREDGDRAVVRADQQLDLGAARG